VRVKTTEGEIGTQTKTPSGSVEFLGRVGGALLEPGKTFYQIIAERRSILESLLLVIIFSSVYGAVIGASVARVIPSLLTGLGSVFGAEAQFTGLLGIVWLIPIATALLNIIGTLILWVISAGISHLCAKYVFKGRGSYVQLLQLFGYAFVPVSLVIAGVLIVGVNLSPLYSLILSLIAVFWAVIILVVAVEKAHQLDAGKAFVSAFIAPLAFYLLILFAAGFAVTSIVGASL